jgi:predicted RecB family nuclease
MLVGASRQFSEWIMSAPITGAMLYDLVQCPHRVTMDLFAAPALKDKVSPFVQLLWEKGSLYEKEVIDGLALPFVDLSRYAGEEKEQKTLAAMDRGESLIYSGRIRAGDLLGDPDLLRREDGGYIAGDIKSGAGEEGGSDDEDGKPKVHYAVQLAIYTDILKQLGRSAGPRAFVWDIHGEEVPYKFNEAYRVRNPRTLWQDYQEVLAEARKIVSRTDRTLPAYSGVCKNCVWFTACLKQLSNDDDLTLIPGLGRSKRDVMIDRIPAIADLAAVNVAGFIKGKKTDFPGIGPDTLEKFAARARLLTTKGAAYLRAPVSLPVTDKELFFDIEVDPMRDVCYLHGFVERTGGDNSKERFVAFFADVPSPEAEERAFRDAWAYMTAAQPAAIYYYSKYERTIYRKLRQKYPGVCSEKDIEDLFSSPQTVDLYFDIVVKATGWPTRDQSLKTLAKHLGFAWRDTHPSGAASIEWFDRWVTSRDASVRQRILDYNEDDCRATRVLLDGIRSLGR